MRLRDMSVSRASQAISEHAGHLTVKVDIELVEEPVEMPLRVTLRRRREDAIALLRILCAQLGDHPPGRSFWIGSQDARRHGVAKGD